MPFVLGCILSILLLLYAFVGSVFNFSREKYSYCFRILMSADELTDAKLLQVSEPTVPFKKRCDFFDVISVVGTSCQIIPYWNKGQASSLNWVIDEAFPKV